MKSVHFNNPPKKVDVFIAGSGPIGATYAKLLVDAGLTVLMVELGEADSFKSSRASNGNYTDLIPGAHKKNKLEFQMDINRFTHVIKGSLSPVSVPVVITHNDILDPSSYDADGTLPPSSNGKNPKQRVSSNLSAEAIARGVGGMSTLWSCATPRFNTMELPVLIENQKENAKEWERIYSAAEKLIGTTTQAFDGSIRHTLVLKTLQEYYKSSRHSFEALPMACHKTRNRGWIEWHATDTILEHIYKNPKKKQLFTLLTNHRCTRVVPPHTGARSKERSIAYAEVKDLLADYRDGSNAYCANILADVFIIAAGAVGTPQILSNSFETKESTIKNLYITEQPLAFCQVVLKQSMVDKVPNNPYKLDWWEQAVKAHSKQHPSDPVKIPLRDPGPQVMARISKERPWHAQVQSDIIGSPVKCSGIDARTIIDLRFYGYVEPLEENRLDFETSIQDVYGMPQPTFRFRMGRSDRERAHRMMDDMCAVANALGGFLPGSEPKFMAPGQALHLGGTTRAGLDPDTHVADTYCKVYGFDNLYVGGNGVIPTGYATSPTLTAMGYAIRSAEFDHQEVSKG